MTPDSASSSPARRLGSGTRRSTEKTAAASDITSHPDYKAKVREAKRFEERLEELEADYKVVEEKLSDFSPEERKRLQGEVAGRCGEHGVAVLMRYTLRLLTLQQFQRAATLICAMETIRREAETAGSPKWGTEPFRIGLWVGMRTTPNSTSQSHESLKLEHGTSHKRPFSVGGHGTPVQLKHCPWCGTADNSFRHISAYPLVCPECERGVRPEWTACPWCYPGRLAGNGRPFRAGAKGRPLPARRPG